VFVEELMTELMEERLGTMWFEWWRLGKGAERKQGRYLPWSLPVLGQQQSHHLLFLLQLEQWTAVPVCVLSWVGRAVGLGWQ
jgi:hypothetical protein